MDRPKLAFVHIHTPSAHPAIPIIHANSFILLIFFILTLSILNLACYAGCLNLTGIVYFHTQSTFFNNDFIFQH